MNKLIIATGLLILIGGTGALAQSGTSPNSPPDMSKPMVQAPVGHRQPKTDEVPNERNLNDPNNPANKEDAELDRKIKSICRGC